MIKKVTKRWLESKGACESSLKHVCKHGYMGLSPIAAINKLIENNRILDANWFIVRVMNKKQKVKYAIFAAEQVIDTFEKRYPDDKRPRQAIEAAKKYLKNPCKKTKYTAADAYAAADAAAYAYAAAYAADAYAAAAYAADAAAYAADAYAADAAAYAADAYAADAYAADAADAAAALRIKILKNGIKILKGEA